ncbi:hypothetical protein [Citrobacter meridianamericanus]
MDLAVKTDDGFYKATFFGKEYICFNCVIDGSTKRPTGIWHRNLPADDTDVFNPVKNPDCSSYKLSPNTGFLTDDIKRPGQSSAYISYGTNCLYYIDEKAVERVLPNVTYPEIKRLF